MAESWTNDNFALMKSLYAVYSIPQAAALWCGIPDDRIQKVLDEAIPTSGDEKSQTIVSHPDYERLEPLSRAVTEAVSRWKLPHGRKDGVLVSINDFVPYDQRYILGRELKKWMEKALPDERPSFLFGGPVTAAPTSPDGELQPLSDTDLSYSTYWNKLQGLSKLAIREYPGWRKTVKGVQKTGNLQEWLTSVVGADNREAEIIKKVLSDFFPELQ
jgi:hypothetical protein